ncbi:sugar transferase [Natrialba swarupiae]|uniref:Sugar transferase n=1 Tax=Natrialba swarupiae TaxID=2448032 RepID=A0A5D5ASY8_9EURY|nr:sugar transferase [Natrialba swarupiae]TYT62131.1 sugar transferase [Natrialba swarupiae]
MVTGWRYRVVSVLGVFVLTAGAVAVANHPTSQLLFTTYVPLFDRLEATVLTGSSLYWILTLSALAVFASLAPLYKPQPRRVLDTVFLVQKRVLVAGLALATLGYFKWSHRLPRATLVMTIGVLSIVLPLWFVWIRNRPNEDAKRALIVGDDLGQIDQISRSATTPLLGYLCPSVISSANGEHMAVETVADGGVSVENDSTVSKEGLNALDRIGGLSRLENILIDYDIDTVVLAFCHADRAEFFGALDTCHEHGVNVKIHHKFADSVLISEGDVGEIINVDLEPWDPLDHLFKRVFDVGFAVAGLVTFAPLFVVIALAIKLDNPGPVLYSQNRTAGFGETFAVYKFRTMVPKGESATPSEDADNGRITRVGSVLRRTHLDELPQLWSILIGNMSVVGPRAAWTEEEVLLQEDTPAWRKRWFVKPGLTGLAQVNDATSTNPGEKLHYDLKYIRRQSFWLDLKIVIRQIWTIIEDFSS